MLPAASTSDPPPDEAVRTQEPEDGGARWPPLDGLGRLIEPLASSPGRPHQAPPATGLLETDPPYSAYQLAASGERWRS